jgi:hypothetical protein
VPPIKFIWHHIDAKHFLLMGARRFTRNEIGAVRTAFISSRFVRYLTTSKGQIVHWTVCSFFVCRDEEYYYHFLPEAIAAFSIPASVSLARANRKTTYFPIARRADPTLNAVSAMEKYGKFRKVASHICIGRSLWALPKLARWASPPWNPQQRFIQPLHTGADYRTSEKEIIPRIISFPYVQ